MNNVINKIIELNKKLNIKNTTNMYLNDFLLTWDRTKDELEAVLLLATILRKMRENNISSKIFDSGLGISMFRDNSTRTRFSFTSACNLLGLEIQDFDESKSQVAHGETVRETANMISFMADIIGIRDDMYIGKGNKYMKDFAHFVQTGYEENILEQRPTIVNLQCDIDHPTQSMSDLLHIVNYFGGIENLKGKKMAMTWAYSPSYGKPLSVPQGIVGLLSRFGMELVLAHPEGYELMPNIEQIAMDNSKKTGGSFIQTNKMSDAFESADIVYPKSWAPFKAMKKRSNMYEVKDFNGINKLEKELLIQNSNFKDWECTEKLMNSTNNSNAIYMHCLPADISGVSCKEGEVVESVFNKHRKLLYQEASFKPYIISAMIFLSKVQDPSNKITQLLNRYAKRLF